MSDSSPPRSPAVLLAAVLLVAGAIGAGLLPAAPLLAQAVAPDSRTPTAGVHEADRLAAELVSAQRAHLFRVLGWGGASLVLGAGLALAGKDGHATRHGFGVQTAAWGAINVGIATWGLLNAPEVAVGPAAAWAAEDRWSHILLVNLGLNVGYMMVGGALHLASSRGLRSGDAVRGHADAVVLQGVALLVLDGLAWSASTARLGELRDLVLEGARVSMSAFDPAAIEVAIRIPWG